MRHNRWLSIRLGLRRGLSAVVAGLLLLPGLLAPPPADTAPLAQTAQPYDGADIVFLIDQSGSMGGKKYGSTIEHPNANDPDDRRFLVAPAAIDYIAQQRYTYASMPNHPPQPWDAQASVVYFGSNLKQQLDYLQITPDSAEQWASVFSPVSAALSAAQFTGNLGNTDFRAAFRAAKDRLDLMRQNKPGHRIHAIIVVTDGSPCAEPPPHSPSYLKCADPIEHMTSLKKDVDGFFGGTDNPLSENRLYVIALNDADPYWTGGPGQPAYGPYWRDMVGQRGFAELLASNTDVQAEAQRAMNELSNLLNGLNPNGTERQPGSGNTDHGISPTTLVTSTVSVRPYLTQITFILDKVHVSDDVAFRTGGSAIDLSGAQRQNSSGLVETIIMNNPPPGRWDV